VAVPVAVPAVFPVALVVDSDLGNLPNLGFVKI
jgi:hypothetical protein